MQHDFNKNSEINQIQIELIPSSASLKECHLYQCHVVPAPLNNFDSLISCVFSDLGYNINLSFNLADCSMAMGDQGGLQCLWESFTVGGWS